MEPGAHIVRRRDPDVVRKQGVQRSPQPCGIPRLRHLHTDRLPARVNARVGTASPLSHDALSKNPGQSALHFTLHGPLHRLDLPAGKGGAVIVQHQLHGARRHPPKSTAFAALIQATIASVEAIDFA